MASELATRLEQDMKDAMRAGDKLRLGAIRRARASVKNAEIEAREPLDDAGVVRVLRGLVKQHEESIEHFRTGGRDDLVAQETAECDVLEAYLPRLLDEAAVERVVAEVVAEEGASGRGDMGRVMKAAMARLGGQADGKLVNAVAARLLDA
jgi:uncharacterized protein